MLGYFAGLARAVAGHPRPRSGRWRTVRVAHLAAHPACAACGSRKKLQVHHVRPFHLDPALELDPANLVTLCEAAGDCHLTFGHLRSWRSHNPAVVADAAAFLARVKSRP